MQVDEKVGVIVLLVNNHIMFLSSSKANPVRLTPLHYSDIVRDFIDASKKLISFYLARCIILKKICNYKIYGEYTHVYTHIETCYIHKYGNFTIMPMNIDSFSAFIIGFSFRFHLICIYSCHLLVTLAAVVVLFF